VARSQGGRVGRWGGGGWVRGLVWGELLAPRRQCGPQQLLPWVPPHTQCPRPALPPQWHAPGQLDHPPGHGHPPNDPGPAQRGLQQAPVPSPAVGPRLRIYLVRGAGLCVPKLRTHSSGVAIVTQGLISAGAPHPTLVGPCVVHLTCCLAGSSGTRMVGRQPPGSPPRFLTHNLTHAHPHMHSRKNPARAPVSPATYPPPLPLLG
jgi:hypothetical protein